MSSADFFSKSVLLKISFKNTRERSGSEVECLTRDWRVAGSSLTGIIALCPWARHINPSLVLVQPRKTCPFITERLLMGRKESNPTKWIPSECRTVRIQIRPDMLSGLIWVQTVCKSYQQMSLVGEELTIHLYFTMLLFLCIVNWHVFWLSFCTVLYLSHISSVFTFLCRAPDKNACASYSLSFVLRHEKTCLQGLTTSLLSYID